MRGLPFIGVRNRVPRVKKSEKKVSIGGSKGELTESKKVEKNEEKIGLLAFSMFMFFFPSLLLYFVPFQYL